MGARACRTGSTRSLVSPHLVSAAFERLRYDRRFDADAVQFAAAARSPKYVEQLAGPAHVKARDLVQNMIHGGLPGMPRLNPSQRTSSGALNAITVGLSFG